MPHNYRMHLTGYGGLRPLPPAGDAGRYAVISEKRRDSNEWKSNRRVIMFACTGPMNATLASPEEPVWFWYATCGGPMMALEMRLDKTTIYKTTFPLCRADRGSINSEGQRSTVQFSFRPHRAIVVEGS